MKWFVSRQHYYDGRKVVEVAQGGTDYANPDMLVVRFKDHGEGKEYEDPRGAVAAAIAICRAWRSIMPGRISVAHGHTGGYTMPFEDTTFSEARKWAREVYEKLPKCDQCGNLLPKEHFIVDDDHFCSEYCAERYVEGLAPSEVIDD